MSYAKWIKASLLLHLPLISSNRDLLEKLQKISSFSQQKMGSYDLLVGLNSRLDLISSERKSLKQKQSGSGVLARNEKREMLGLNEKESELQKGERKEIRIGMVGGEHRVNKWGIKPKMSIKQMTLAYGGTPSKGENESEMEEEEKQKNYNDYDYEEEDGDIDASLGSESNQPEEQGENDDIEEGSEEEEEMDIEEDEELEEDSVCNSNFE